MKSWLLLLLSFAAFQVTPDGAWAASDKSVAKPADLPARFRDFQIYATSTADADNRARIVVEVQLHNNGAKPLPTTIQINANRVAGFAGGQTKVLLKPKSRSVWKFDLWPSAALKSETLTGSITFGATRARDLFIGLQGPDDENFSSSGVYRAVKKITAKAEVTGTFAPRTPINW